MKLINACNTNGLSFFYIPRNICIKPRKSRNTPKCLYVKPKIVKGKDILVNLIVLLVKFDFGLKSSIVKFIFTSSGKRDFNSILISLISCTPDCIVYPIVDPEIYFISNTSKVPS